MIYKLNREDFDYTLVSASDGIWDALPLQDFKDFYLQHKSTVDVEELCRKAVEKARKTWMTWETSGGGATVDDISIQILQLF